MSLIDHLQRSHAYRTAWPVNELKQSILAPSPIQNAQGRPTRFLNGCAPAREAKLPKMRDALKGIATRQKKFSSPDRTIGPVSGPVPGHAEHGRVQFIFSDAGQNMRPMMLHENGSFPELAS